MATAAVHHANLGSSSPSPASRRSRTQQYMAIMIEVLAATTSFGLREKVSLGKQNHARHIRLRVRWLTPPPPLPPAIDA